MKTTTRYYRNALRATAQEVIDFREKEFAVVTQEEIEKGEISVEKLTANLGIKWDSRRDKDEDVKPIIIAAKTIVLNYEYSQNTSNVVDELTSLLFIPAVINKEGELKVPEDNQLPWIPREYLEPMCESVLSFGQMSDLDTFYNGTDSDRFQINTWEKYYEYAKKLFKKVCKADFEDAEIIRGEEKYSFDGKFYVILNDRVNAAHNIIALYDYLYENDENALYSKLTSGEEEKLKPLIAPDSIPPMMKHVGQMNGEYELSPSQRNAMAHFCDICDGDILAVSGPPGTGKTTLLQSIVANMYVERALVEDEAPVIVASSTNNQAVTNIIDSFGKINSCFDEIFEKKWIDNSDSFATYMPSQMRVAEAERKGYQHTDISGASFFELIESEENRSASKDLFLQNYNDFYCDEVDDICQCKDEIHKCLLKIDAQRLECLNIISKISEVLREHYSYSKNDIIEIIKTPCEQEKALDEMTNNLKEEVSSLQTKEEQFDDKRKNFKARYRKWNEEYHRLPWYIRLFKFFPMFKRRISNFIFGYMLDSELTYLHRSMDFDSIIREYKNQICILDKEIFDIQATSKELQSKIDLLEKKKLDLQELVNTMTYAIEEAYSLLPKLRELSPKSEDVKNKTIQELNDLLDKVRYMEFWLSVHYFEAKWLITENTITEKQKGKNFKTVLVTMYRRLAMLSPCFVMTFYMLPKNFKAYDGNEKKNFYINDLIDLLIVDEAGQATLEVAAASFALANKAVVVGDEKQIPPVYGVVKAVDCTIAKEQGLIVDYSEFDSFEKKRLSCSSSSVMGRALLCCAYDEYEHGLFLSEHRRCFDEIIGYCNDLLYSGKLKPMRGTAFNEKNPLVIKDSPEKGIQPMCYVQIDSEKSEKVGTSRINKKEASEIVNWIRWNFDNLCTCYSDTRDEEVLAVITPFKSQSDLLKKILHKELPEIADKIGVGTVHTFQGGEKKVIIFSTVYGINDGYYFIRTNANLMNVAVSRAKDAFIVFGDLRGFQTDNKSPDGLLRKAVGYVR